MGSQADSPNVFFIFWQHVKRLFIGTQPASKVSDRKLYWRVRFLERCLQKDTIVE